METMFWQAVAAVSLLAALLSVTLTGVVLFADGRRAER